MTGKSQRNANLIKKKLSSLVKSMIQNPIVKTLTLDSFIHALTAVFIHMFLKELIRSNLFHKHL